MSLLHFQCNARSAEPVDPIASYSKALHQYTRQQWLEARKQAEKEAQNNVRGFIVYIGYSTDHEYATDTCQPNWGEDELHWQKSP